MTVHVKSQSKVHEICNQTILNEEYYCNFGLNPEYKLLIDEAGLRVVGGDDNGETRIVEIRDHPFYIGTLFVPQVRSTEGQPHVLVTAFLKVALMQSHMEA